PQCSPTRRSSDLSYLKMVLHLVKGDRMDQRDILRRLAELQYARNDLDFRRATYRVRGDVIDVFPADAEDQALRIELFDEEIESLSRSEEHTSELQSRENLVCRLLL